MTPSDREDRFNGLYACYAGRVCAWFSVGFGRDIAEDLAQQTFLNVWKFLGGWTFTEPDSWRAWIFHAAKNVRNDYLRTRQGLPALLEYDDALDSGETRTADDLLESIAVKTAFQQLTQEDRDLLTYRSIGLTSREIGEIMDLSASAVRSRMQKARDRFQMALADCGVHTNA